MPGFFEGCFGILPGKRADTDGSGRQGVSGLSGIWVPNAHSR